MREELVRIKGVNNGIILFLDDKVSFEKVINDLFILVTESLPVLSSNKIVIDLGDRKDINPYINKIIEKFKSLSLKLDKIIIRNNSQENYDDIDLFFAPTLKNNRDLTTFLKNTVRSGQQIFAEGDIIVVKNKVKPTRVFISPTGIKNTDLKIVEGIGPKIEGLLKRSGIDN